MPCRRSLRRRKCPASAGLTPFHVVQEGVRELLCSAGEQTGAEGCALYVRLDGTRRYVLAGEWKPHEESLTLPHGLPADGFRVSGKGEKLSRTRLFLSGEEWQGLWVPLRSHRKLWAFLLLLWRGRISPGAFAKVKGDRSLWSTLAYTLIATAKVASEWEAFRAVALHWESLWNMFPFALILLDGSGRALLSNHLARTLLQLPQEQVPGEEWASLLYRLPEEIRPQVARAVEVSLGGVPHQEVLFTRRRRCLRIHALPLSKGVGEKDRGSEVGGCVLLIEDFTDSWEKERQWEEAKRLAEIGQMTATIAHELRNPLTSIRGAAQLIREEGCSSRVGQWAEIIEEEAEEMDAVLTQCLELATPPPLVCKPLSLASVVERILRQQSPVFQKSGIRVIWKKPLRSPRVQGDGIQLGQALRNLIRNSIQAMPSGGELRVSVGEDGVDAYMVVEDTGVGISREILEKVFTPFFTTKANGTGLGLCNVKRVVEAHGGRVSLESEPGRGTRFTIYLPCLGKPPGLPGSLRDGERREDHHLERGRWEV